MGPASRMDIPQPQLYRRQDGTEDLREDETTAEREDGVREEDGGPAYAADQPD